MMLFLHGRLEHGPLQLRLSDRRAVKKIASQEALAWAMEVIEKYAPKAEWSKAVEAQAEDWKIKYVMSYGDWTLVQDKKSGNIEASSPRKEAFIIEAA
jgi:hypothetical protein